MAKLKNQDFEAHLKNGFSKLAGILFYGPDRGQSLENMERAADAVAPDAADGFSVFEFDGAAIKSEPAKLFDEATTISFLGTRKVVKIKDATNDIAEVVAELAAKAKLEALLLIAADELPPASKLRQTFENSDRLGALPSYNDEGESLSSIIRATLAKNGIKKIPDEVLMFIREHSGENRAATRMELEKLSLYLAGKTEITLEDAEACIMDTSLLSMQDLSMSVAEGNSRKLASVLPRLLSEGNYPVQLLRSVLSHFKGLYFMAGEVEGGKPAAAVISEARPPIFFKLKASYERQLKNWGTEKIMKAISKMFDAEIMCKRAASPAETIVSQLLFSLCAAAGKKQA
ncbi:MAG: DNA polymerase III subunit delta [Rickettsiales bacterium]|jgi:DNA polymerase-3 subunit delta|nr:DNA polymerase III subunit delta [Rickettsiales bacterium]